MAQKKSAPRKTTTRSTTPSRKKSSSAAKTARPGLNLDERKQAIVGGMVLMGFSFILILSLASPNQGQLTSALSQAMRLAFGWGGIVVPLVLVAVGFYLVLWGMEQTPRLPRTRLLGLALFFAVFEAFASLLMLAMDGSLPDVWAVATAG